MPKSSISAKKSPRKMRSRFVLYTAMKKAYREGQFSGLKPATRKKHRSQRLPENFEFLVEQAIQLRKEVPERSIAQIILILELEGHVAPGF